MAERSFREIHFGYAEAERESAKEPALLLDGFLDPGGMIADLIDGDKFLVLGNKGSGKSSIAQHISLRAQAESDLFVRVAFLSNFPFERFAKAVPGDEDARNNYPDAWATLLLLYIIDSLTSDEGLSTAPEFDRAIRTLSERQLLPTANLRRLALASIKRTVRSPLPFAEVGGEATHEVADNPAFFSEQLRELMRAVHTSSRHVIIIDGLDDVLISTTEQFELLAALAYEVDRVNAFAESLELPAKVILVCRTDLYERLPGSNKNKLRQDATVELDWSLPEGDRIAAPLLRLVNRKAQVSDPTIADVIDEFLPSDLGTPRRPASYLLDFTRHIPRDILQLLRAIQAACSGERPTTGDVGAGLQRYALHYFLPEVKDELAGLFPDSDVVTIFELLARLSTSQFTLEDLRQLGAGTALADSPERLAAILHGLYEASAIGNVRRDQVGSDYFAFRYRNQQSALDLTEPIILHRSLWLAIRPPHAADRQPKRRRARAGQKKVQARPAAPTVTEEELAGAMRVAREAAARVLETGNPERLPPFPGRVVDAIMRGLVQGPTGLVGRSRKSPKGSVLTLSRASAVPKVPDAKKVGLHELVRDAVMKHLRTGEPVELDPMDASQRQAVHHIVRTTYRLQTNSVGDEPSRSVCVFGAPKD